MKNDSFESFWVRLHPVQPEAAQVESETPAGWSTAQKVATATVTGFVVLGFAFYWA